ncbi:hypothetical protein BGZ50_005761 [Haplosporangium sp. Z 11]|nr:hypothetical protein BGZ50_005761 [Haplosporangium sp. Z 11]
MHQTAHSSFVSDFGMNPPQAWSKPASALGLTNSMNHHLPQAQSVRELQEQIQQHRRLQQQQSQSGYGLGGHTMKKKHCQQSGNSNNNSNNNNSNKEHNGGNGGNGSSATHQPTFGSGRQHINIKNTDDSMNSDEETDEDDDDMDNNNNNASMSRNHQSGMQDQHPRSLPHPQLTQGFTIPTGFTSFAPSSPLSPSSPGSITSDSSAITASMLSPGLYSTNYNSSSSNNGSSIHGIESSLASLASLSVMSSSASASAMSMSMPGRGRSGFSPTHLATTPTTSSFQQQSLPMVYQNQASGIMGPHHHASGFLATSSAAPSFNVFSSALSQHFQRQQQQQQQMTSAAMSSSLPAHSGFNQLQQQQHLAHTQHIQNHPREQQDENQQQGQQPSKQQSQKRTRSKSLTIPAPRIIPPTRILPPRQPQTSAPRKYHGRQQRKIPSAQPTTPKENADPTRRVAHIISEQKRREKINGGFDELKSVIPE